ncbi:hypothetical protein B7494_g5908 [Chlorociboria aeruginascens]|nr:hypothetical protein B7494_g5908 [Chlorociboria aeruginascens]
MSRSAIHFRPGNIGAIWNSLLKIARSLLHVCDLPPHPGATGCLEDTLRIKCEVATMRYVRSKTSISVPEVFANEMEGLDRACLTGTPYMIIEGFRGTTLQDAVDLFEISNAARQKILDQWSLFQAELATLTFRHISAIGAKLDADSKPIIGKIATDEAGSIRPFSDATEYLYIIANAKYQRALNGQIPEEEAADRFDVLGPYIFCDFISRVNAFQSLLPGLFPLSHMNMGAQNLLIDNAFNIIAVVDWEMAQTAPWEARYFPMPFPANVASDIDFQKQLSYRVM